MFQEFPKGLSQSADDWVIVFDAEQEAEARARGYRFASEDESAEPKKRPGRTPKGKE